MKITVEREKILSAFQIAASVIPTRTTKPILKNVKLVGSASRTYLVATDTEMTIQIDIPDSQTQVAGEVLLLADRFGPILRESSDEKLDIQSDGNMIHVRGERSEFHLPVANSDEFPGKVEFSEESYFRIPSPLLLEVIRRTVFATEAESSRYALGGVLLELNDTSFIAVSTDGRRLAKMEGVLERVGEPVSANPEAVIVAARAMNLIERVLVDATEPVELAIKESDLVLRTSRTILSSRLVEGRFPRWRDVVRREAPTVQVELPVGPLASAVRQAAILTDKETRAIDFRFTDGLLELAGWGADIGNCRVELPVAFHGSGVTVALDNRFMSEYLRVLEPQKTVTFTTTGDDSPAEFHSDDGYLYLVMPMERKKAPKGKAGEVVTA